MLRTVQATRYVTPLREGGSLPGLVEADDLGIYVVKFRGAGQGLKALVAEVIVAEIGRRIGLQIPELVVVELDPAIGKREPDEEVQDLLQASSGTNLGVDFLPGSLGYDGVSWRPDPQTAARVLWLDAFTVNVDRSWRNPNLLVWHRRLWCIDHGAALTFQHAWPDPDKTAHRPYDFDDHVLGEFADGIAQADADLRPIVSRAMIEDAVGAVPPAWLEPPAPGPTAPGPTAPGPTAPCPTAPEPTMLAPTTPEPTTPEPTALAPATPEPATAYVEHLSRRLQVRGWVPR